MKVIRGIHRPSGETIEIDVDSIGLSLLGPFDVSFDDEDSFTDGMVIATLPAGTVVVMTMVDFETAWDSAGNLDINIGGDDYLPPNDDYSTIASYNAQSVPSEVSGARVLQAPGSNFIGGAYLITDGALVVWKQNIGTPTQGLAHIYALVKYP